MKRFALIAVVALLPSAAMAADFNARIVNVDGTPLKDDAGKEVTLTVRTVTMNALLAPYKDESELPADEKVRRGRLAMKISNGETGGIAGDDIVLIKKLVNRYYASPLVVTQTFDALDK